MNGRQIKPLLQVGWLAESLGGWRKVSVISALSVGKFTCVLSTNGTGAGLVNRPNLRTHRHHPDRIVSEAQLVHMPFLTSNVGENSRHLRRHAVP